MTIGDIRRASPRWWALAALASLVVVAAGLVQVVVGSRDQLLQLLVGTVLSVAVMAATAWWAFTTRRVWKRWLNITIAALAVANIVLGFLEFGFRQAAGAAGIVIGSLAYAIAAHRALRPAAGRGPAPKPGRERAGRERAGRERARGGCGQPAPPLPRLGYPPVQGPHMPVGRAPARPRTQVTLQLRATLRPLGCRGWW